MELHMDRAEVTRHLNERIAIGEEILNRTLRHHDDLTAAAQDRRRFDQFNGTLIDKAFGPESKPTREYRDATNDIPIPISVGNAPSLETYARAFKASTSTRINALRSVLEQVALYYDPPEVTKAPNRSEAVSAEAARAGLDPAMVDIMERLSQRPDGVDSVHEVGFSTKDPDTDRAFRALKKRRLIAVDSYTPLADGSSGMVHGVSLTDSGWRLLGRIRNGPPAPAQIIKVDVAGDNYGNVQAAGAGSSQTATTNVDASVTNDLAAFAELLRAALDEDGERLGGDAYAILDAQLDALGEEVSTGQLNPKRIRGFLLAIIGVLGALGLDGRWPDILEAGQTILERLPGG